MVIPTRAFEDAIEVACFDYWDRGEMDYGGFKVRNR